MNIDFTAQLQSNQVAINEALQLVVRATNSGKVNVNINDPMSINDSLSLKLVHGEGDTAKTQIAILSSDHQPLPHGVPSVPRTLSVPSSLPVDIPIDLHRYFKLNEPGIYRVSVIYTWQGDNTWYSPEYAFKVAAANGEALGNVPNESSGSGFHGLYWLESSADQAKVLLLPWRLQAKKVDVNGASAIGILPSGAQVTLSTQPADDPLPDRWLIGVTKNSLYASFASEDEEFAMAPVVAKLPHSMTLIKPALASLAPDEDRPSCSIGLVASSNNQSVFNLLNVASDGQFSANSPVQLPGIPKDSWAMATKRGDRLFYFIMDNDQHHSLYRIVCPINQPCGQVETLLEAKGAFLIGDVRILPDGQIAYAAIISLEDNWVRVVYRGTPASKLEIISEDELILDKINRDQDTQLIKNSRQSKLLRLDQNGDAHFLYIDTIKQSEPQTAEEQETPKSAALHYISPKAQTPQWHSTQSINNTALVELIVLASNQAKLVYYHPLRGIMVEDL